MSVNTMGHPTVSSEPVNLDPFLDDLFVRGIVLHAEGENLQLRGAKGVLTPEIVARLKEHKGAILRKLTEPVQRYPLSYGQEALWFTVQQAADSPLYNVSIALRVHSPVDPVALQRTFQAFIVRHPLLRTTFEQVNSKPQQVVQRFQEPDLAQIQAAGWDDETLDAQVLATHEQPFDLHRGPLMRVTLFTRSEADHILLCTMHHIVTDGWSLWMLLDEFRQLYPVAQRGPLTLSALAALPQAARSYADYVAWQQRMVTEEGNELWRYWEQQLAGELPVLDLPTDRPRPRVQSYRGASHHFTLADVVSTKGNIGADTAQAGVTLSQQLRQLAQREGATLYTLLLAAFQVLLHRYSGQDEILVGSPTAGRSRPEFAPIFGYFTSPVVLRGKLADNPTFLDFLGQMRTTVLEALAHQDFPFGLLVDRLQRGRDSSRPPLYQATFALQKPQQTDHILNAAAAGEAGRMGWGGLVVSPYELGQYQGRVDILLEMIEGPEAITATLRYSTDLFDATTIEQMAERFVTLLQGIVENPHQSIAHLPLLSTTEQQALIAAGRGPTVTYPTVRSVHQLFADQTARTPDVAALVFLQCPLSAGRHRCLTYREVNERANQLAHYLRTCGVGHTATQETLVGICLDRSPEMVISILAVLKAGGAYVPLDPAYPPERMAFIMADAGLGWILTNATLAATLPDTTAQLLRWEGIAADVAAQPTENPASQEMTTPEQLAYVIYTSGSTGRPKGVMVEHRGIPNLAYAQMEAFGVTAESRVLQFASFSFDASVSELFKTLLAGATLYMADRDTLLPGPALIELFQREAITMVTLPPSVLAALPFAELPALQSLIVAGEACPVELAQRWAPGRRFLNAYGPTEATVCATIGELTPAEMAATPRSLSIGQPIANGQVYILDQYQQPVPPGVPGELYIGGIGVARGYLNRPELTAEKFMANPFSGETEPDRLYRTGDRARYVPNTEPGRFQIEFLGRVDNQVKLRGFRIELGEIETLLLQHAAVREAAVILHTDDAANQQLVAYVAPEVSTGEVEGEHISYWQNVNTQIFGNAPQPKDLTFNITGWSNSYTGLPFADVEMQEWVESTVAAILALQPKRVLEIGCGTGLLLSRIAPHCERYVGADFSPEVLQTIRQLQAVNPALSHVTLEERSADNLAGLELGSFDLVILNSVIQYFPTVEYLQRVLHGAVQVLQAGGKIFVGDVRSLPHLTAYHAAVQLATADNELTRAQLAQQVQRTMQEEEELVVDPCFFVTLPHEVPQLADVEIQLKRGKHANELMQFRYSALLHVAPEQPAEQQGQSMTIANAAELQWLDWEKDALTLPRLRQFLTAEQPPLLLGVRHMPNRRVQKATEITSWLAGEHEQTVGELLPQLTTQMRAQAALDPEEVWALGEACGYQVDITWSELGAYRKGMDVLFKRPDVTASVSVLYKQLSDKPPKSWSALANSPLQGTLRRKLAPQLHEFLHSHLPGYMVPSTLILLDVLPLNNSGKVDRRALPAPTLQRSVKSFMPPTTPLEKKLATAWCEVLGVDRVSIHDDFFDLGGNSLLMVQLTSAMSAALEEQVGAKELMLNPTIAQFAQSYEKRTAAAQVAPAQGVPPATTGTPQNGAVRTLNGLTLPEVPHIRWEKRSLLSLFVTGKLPPIDVAALAYLSSTAMKNSGLSRDEVVYEHFENLPLLSTIMETAWGRVGLITIPRLGTELYQDEEVMDLILEGLQMAGRFGAKVVSLTGLIPSATDYGNAILAASTGYGELPQVTTGHATTSAAVLLSMQRLLQEAKRDLQHETVGFIGLGSVGMATLHTMLQAMPHPKALILCDLFSKAETLAQTRRDLIDQYGYTGEIQVATAHAAAPDAIYAATLIVGATNVPDVLEIGRVQPGTLLVDDSAPHCFDVQQAIQRLETQEDILFTEGGVLELPQPIQYHVHATRPLEPMLKDTRLFKETEATGCVFSSLLAARYPELTPTIGLVDPHAGAAHYAKLQELGIRAAALHCRDYHLPKRLIRSFRYRFGGK